MTSFGIGSSLHLVCSTFAVEKVSHFSGAFSFAWSWLFATDHEAAHFIAPDDVLFHFQPHVANRERLAEKRELMPPRPAVDVEIAAKPQRMNLLADRIFDRCDAGEIDDRDDFGRDVYLSPASP